MRIWEDIRRGHMEDIARGLLRIPLDTVGGSPRDFITLDEATDKMRLFFIVQTSILVVHHDDLNT